MNIIRWISVIVLTALLCVVIWRGSSGGDGYSENLNINDISTAPLEDRVTYPLELADSEWRNLMESYQYFHDQGILVEDTWIKRAENRQLSLDGCPCQPSGSSKGVAKSIFRNYRRRT